MLGNRIRSPAALSTLGFFSTVPIGFNRSLLSSVINITYEDFIHMKAPCAFKITLLLFKENCSAKLVNKKEKDKIILQSERT